MKSEVFKVGNHVWECKSSYTDPGGAINVTYLKSAIYDVEVRWKMEGMPTGYYYVFPVNLISNDGRRILDKFKNDYGNEVSINYYDRDDMQKLIQNLEKLNNMQSLVDYINKIWMG